MLDKSSQLASPDMAWSHLPSHHEQATVLAGYAHACSKLSFSCSTAWKLLSQSIGLYGTACTLHPHNFQHMTEL